MPPRARYRPVGALVRARIPPARIAPMPALSDRVVTYFLVELGPGEAHTVRTVPDGCADLIFDLGSEAHAWFGGPRTRARVFERVGELRLFGAQLFPGVGRLLLAPTRTALVDGSLALGEALANEPLAASLLAALCRVSSAEAGAALLDEFLLAQLGTREVDRRLAGAVATILDERGALGIAALAKQHGCSVRTLTRLFQHWIGVSPKNLSRVVRFQGVLGRMQEGIPPDWAELAAELGYADQAHLVRDFAEFSLLTPARAARTRTRR